MKKRLLCVSWSSLILKLDKGEIEHEQLDDALFYFGCTFEHVKTPWAEDKNYLTTPQDSLVTYSPKNELTWLDSKTRRQSDELHTTVLKAVYRALGSDRARFRELNSRNSYEELNQLLADSGFEQLDSSAVNLDGGRFSYPGVETRVEKAGLPLEVIH